MRARILTILKQFFDHKIDCTEQVHHEVLELIKELECGDSIDATNWELISEKSIPDDLGFFVYQPEYAHTIYRGVSLAYFGNGKIFDTCQEHDGADIEIKGATHWMSLPPPPKDKDEVP